MEHLPEVTLKICEFYYNIPILFLTGIKYGIDTLEKKNAEYEYKKKKQIAEDTKNVINSLLVFTL